MFYFSLAIGTLIFIGTVIRIFTLPKDFNIRVRNALFGILLLEFVLIFPIFYEKYQAVPAILSSFFYSLKCLGGKQAIDEIFITGANKYSMILYYTLHYTAFAAAPLVTSGLIISSFGDMSDRIRRRLIIASECHIFSDLNEESLVLAKSIKSKKERKVLIFCNTKNADNTLKIEARKIGAVLIYKSQEKLILLHRYRKISFYQINFDEDENVKKSIEIIQQHRKRACEELNLFSFISSYCKTQVLESVDYGNINVHIINVTMLACYNRLKDQPLYLNCNEKNKVSVLIVGAGETGIEFLKAVSWCGQIFNKSLEINVFDKDAVMIEKRFYTCCPELRKPEYNIRFVHSDATCTDFEEKLNEYCKDTTYIVIAMKDDDLNVDTALFLRGLYLRNNVETPRYPIINARVRNAAKNRQFLRSDRFIDSRDITLFGSIETTYNISNVIDSKIEQMARSIHCYYSLSENPTKEEADGAMRNYYGKEYNRRSSMANALHIQYKLFSCGIFSANESEFTQMHSEKFKTLIETNEVVKEQLAKLEHLRWNAFMRSIGYRGIEVSKIRHYTQFGKKKSYINTVAMLHPCITDMDELENVSKVVSELTGHHVDFIKSDYTMVEAIPTIIEGILKEYNKQN